MTVPTSTLSRTLLGVTGWSGSGKTQLIVRLIPVLSARGYRVSTVKHAHHRFDIDTPGKDSHSHREAGAVEVAVTSANRWAIMHENHDEPEPSLDQILARMGPADLYLIEGFKTGAHPKIEVHRGEMQANLICRDEPTVVALATDASAAELNERGIGPGRPLPILELDDEEAIADFVVSFCGLSPRLRGAL